LSCFDKWPSIMSSTNPILCKHSGYLNTLLLFKLIKRCLDLYTQVNLVIILRQCLISFCSLISTLTHIFFSYFKNVSWLACFYLWLVKSWVFSMSKFFIWFMMHFVLVKWKLIFANWNFCRKIGKLCLYTLVCPVPCFYYWMHSKFNI
jgi:hypothetical protein